MSELMPTAVSRVLVEIQSGGGLFLSAAGRLFPGHRGGPSVDASTVFRWMTRGMKGGDGKVVKLEAVRVGSRWLTSKGAVSRFVTALTSAATPVDQLCVPPNTPGTRPAAIRRAVDQLVKHGA